MAQDMQEFELETLRKDDTWKRLVMQTDSGTFTNVFSGAENPFAKNSATAMETAKRLAADGKLYVREFARARHFRKAELDGEKVKLGDMQEHRLSSGASGKALGLLMWLSRGYFKWLGFEGIANRFDKRLQQRRELIEQSERYKDEYNSLSKEAKKKLKELRKQEKAELKARKRLEKAEKEAEKARKELDKVQGKDPSAEKQAETKPVDTVQEQKEQTINQPTQDKVPIQNQNDAPQLQTTAPTQTENTVQTNQQEQPAATGNPPINSVVVGGVEFSRENFNALPANVQQALKLIEDFAKQQAANQPQAQPQPQPQAQPQPQPQQVQQPQPQPPAQPQPQPQQQVQNPMQNTGIPEPPPLVQNKTTEQRLRDQQLAAEQQTIDNASQWHENAAKALFTNGDSTGVLNDYENFKNNRDNGRDPMLAATLGILANAAQQNDGAKKSKEVMDALLSGRPLDNSYSQIIKDGVQSATEILADEDPAKLQQLLSNGVREFSKRAGEEPGLSLRSLQLGEMINSALTMTQKENLNLGLNENELIAARGAATMAKIARNYHEARVYLSGDPMDITSEKGKKALGDLMTGNAVNFMLKNSHSNGEKPSRAQTLMGARVWSEETLAQMTDSSGLKNSMKPEDVKKILNDPSGFTAAKTANDLIKDFTEKGEAEQTIESAGQWRENATKVLFTNSDPTGVLNAYENIFGANRNENRDPLMAATLGILANAAQQNDGAKKSKEVMDSLLNGRPLDASFTQIIKDGVKTATEILADEDPTKLQQLLSNGVREFSKRAGEEQGLSLRNLMLGKLISSALTMAQKENLNLNLNEAELTAARGAVTMAKVARNYHEARAYLSGEPMDITSEKGTKALGDLLTGNAVNFMLKDSHNNGEKIPRSQILMGAKIWSEENLAKMTNSSGAKNNVTQFEVKKILNDPSGYAAARTANSLIKAFTEMGQELQKANQRVNEREIEVEQNQNQMQMNPV